MKIVVLDGYTENPGDLSWAPLEALGEVTVYDRTSYEESPLIAERIGDAEIVVMNKTPISKTTLEKCPNVKMIAVLATGFNVVDLAAAKERGIPAVVGKCTMFGNARTVIEDPGRCFMKIVAHAETHEILGASLMCQHASDMISQISAAMVNHQTAEELRRVMRPHPSFEEAMTEALDALASKLA